MRLISDLGDPIMARIFPRFAEVSARRHAACRRLGEAFRGRQLLASPVLSFVWYLIYENLK
jgi:hypothetical protein